MTVRDILAANFKKLRDATPTLNRPRDIVEAGAATNGTIGRINKKQSGSSVDTLEKLAGAYGIEPWQMLVPTLEAIPGKSGKPVVTGLPRHQEVAGEPGPNKHTIHLDHKVSIECASMIDSLDDSARHRVRQFIREELLRMEMGPAAGKDDPLRKTLPTARRPPSAPF